MIILFSQHSFFSEADAPLTASSAPGNLCLVSYYLAAVLKPQCQEKKKIKDLNDSLWVQKAPQLFETHDSQAFTGNWPAQHAVAMLCATPQGASLSQIIGN